jgi:hypothetical protein
VRGRRNRIWRAGRVLVQLHRHQRRLGHRVFSGKKIWNGTCVDNVFTKAVRQMEYKDWTEPIISMFFICGNAFAAISG